jgi:alkylation response protein AidB-like acyl-CoA dehydrogenase
MLVPEKFGGGTLSGQGLLDLTLIVEETGRLVSPGPLLPVNVVAAALAGASTADRHADTVEALVSGDAIAAWCGPAPRIEAINHDGGYLLHGFAEPVEAGAQADWFLVTATNQAGPTQFLVPATAPGLSVTPLESLDLVRRFARVRFDGVPLDPDAVVGAAGNAAEAAERQWQLAVVIQSAETVGALERVFEFTTAWAFDRYSFGRPLASYQALKHRFADMKMWLEACNATTTAAARAVQEGAADAGELASVAKSYIGERATDIVQDCVQLHGGIGVTWEHDIHLYLRRVTVNRMTYGTPSEHRRRIADLLTA